MIVDNLRQHCHLLNIPSQSNLNWKPTHQFITIWFPMKKCKDLILPKTMMKIYLNLKEVKVIPYLKSKKDKIKHSSLKEGK